MLFYAGPRWLSETHQQALLDYVKEGGNLVFFTSLPLYRDQLQRLNLLGLRLPDRIPEEPFLDHLATETEITLGTHKIRTRAPFFVYDRPTPGERINGVRVDTDAIMDTAFEENKFLRSLVIGHRYQVGYHERRGAGTITVLGITPTGAAIKAVHDWLDVPVPVYSCQPDVKVSIFERNSSYYLVAINTATHDVVAPLDLNLPVVAGGLHTARNLRTDPNFELDSTMLANGRLYLRMPRKNGTIIEIT